MSQPPTEARRAAHLRLLVEREGVALAEAEDFLAVVDAAADEDPEFHARFLEELDRRVLVREAEAEARRAHAAHGVLAALSSTRDARVGPGDVRRLVERARQAVR